MSIVNVHVIVDGRLDYSFAIRGPWTNSSVTNKFVNYVRGSPASAAVKSRALRLSWTCVGCGTCVTNLKKYIRSHKEYALRGLKRVNHNLHFEDVCTDCVEYHKLLRQPIQPVPVMPLLASNEVAHVAELYGTMDLSEVPPVEVISS